MRQYVLNTDGSKDEFTKGDQGNLLRGIDIWSGVDYKAQKIPFDNSFSNIFFQHNCVTEKGTNLGKQRGQPSNSLPSNRFVVNTL